MSSKDDKDWLNLLEGKEVPDADPNTLDEVEALKIALHTELQWQKLQIRMQAEEPIYARFVKWVKEIYTRFVKWMKKTLVSLRDFFSWKPLSLAVAYTFVVVVATLKIAPPIEIFLPRASPIQKDACSVGSIVRRALEPEQEIIELKKQFESAGAETSYQKIIDKVFLLEISPPESPSQELQNLWDEKSINTVLSSNCPVSLLFIALE